MNEEKKETPREEIEKGETRKEILSNESSNAGNEERNNLNLPILDQVKAERLRAEAAVKELKKENDRREKLMAENMLGGQTDGGAPEKTISEDDKKKKGALDFFKGTQIEKAIQKYG